MMRPATPAMVQSLLRQETVETILPGSNWHTSGPSLQLDGLPIYSLPPHGLHYASVSFSEQSSLPTVFVAQTLIQYSNADDAKVALEMSKGLDILYDSPPSDPDNFLSTDQAPELSADAFYFRCERWGQGEEDRYWCATRMQYGRYFAQVVTVLANSNLRAFTRERFFQLLKAIDGQMVELSQQ
jgi:hypothetical protein